ncbi:glycosyltransferase family 2 protein [Herbidospora mongoliensis]|uniref:glycosyltransferase family 2 protein n=1 Tax=Herbidospora mongoliensis TaxID=688067 RepID=UPI00082AA2D9|nr:glycosyltransferase family 2 protein [Herbidospora mongoliensis]
MRQGLKVSVAVPVGNAGPADDSFDACVRSLLELPPDDYEVIFADDGSTDGTRKRLDALAATRPNVRVLHLDRTGDPAHGRNAALSVALGEYVFLMNAHDRLEPGALGRLFDRARETEADVLVGRLTGDGPPAAAFTRDRDRADLLRDRLLSAVTAHKLFRREFIETCQLRFADRALSEQAFVLRAYLSAKVIAVAAGHVVCHVAPANEPEPGDWDLVAGLSAIMDIVDAQTEPGVQRDRIAAHWFRSVALHRLGPSFLGLPAERQELLYGHLKAITAARFPGTLDTHLPVHLRARAALLRTGDAKGVADLARAARGTRLGAELGDLRWEGHVLSLTLTAELLNADGSPMVFAAEGDRVWWVPPSKVDRLDPALREITEAAHEVRMEVYVRHSQTGEMHFLPVTGEVERLPVEGGVRLRASGDARFDVGTAAFGRPLDAGVWEVHVRMRGVNPARTRVGRPDRIITSAGMMAEYPRRLVVPCWSDKGELSVCVEPRSFAESIALVSQAATVSAHEGAVFVSVPVPYVPPNGGPSAELLLRRAGGRTVVAPALIEPGEPGKFAGQLIAKLPAGRGGLTRGFWRPRLRMDGSLVDLRFVIETQRGKAVVRTLETPRPPTRWKRLVADIRRRYGMV